MRGKVYLVGAGPGDPELLTRKALRVMQAADIVLHDALVTPEILALVSPAAQVCSVGKRCGRRGFAQEQINALMVAEANEGRTVVRLKGGDPLLFGRAGEEMEALRGAGIDFEVVPGVTAAAAAAAAAQIPLTDRRSASKLFFLTGHRCNRKASVELRHAVSSDATLVVYMPGENYSALATELDSAGWSGQTPCVIVSRAAASQEKIHRTRLERLSHAPRLAAPALLIIGWVAATARHADWQPDQPDPLIYGEEYSFKR